MPARSLVVVVGFLLIPSIAAADGHRAEYFFGLSFATGSTLTGFHLSAEPVSRKNAFFVIDYSAHWGNDKPRHTGQIGGHYSRKVKGTSLNGRVLMGVVSDAAGTDFSTTAGGGLQFKISEPKTARAESPHWTFEVRAEYVHRYGENPGFPRYSMGFVRRLPQ